MRPLADAGSSLEWLLALLEKLNEGAGALQVLVAGAAGLLAKRGRLCLGAEEAVDGVGALLLLPLLAGGIEGQA